MDTYSLADSHHRMQSANSPEPAIAVNLQTRHDPVLLQQKRWVCWGYVQDERGTLKKPPFDPRTGKMIDTTQPGRQFVNFDEALESLRTNRCQKYQGIGYVFNPSDHIIRIDLDEVIQLNNSTGNYTIKPWAWNIIKYLNTYTELSPSGDGVHILARGWLNDHDRTLNDHHIHIEMYNNSTCYLTWTGELFTWKDEETGNVARFSTIEDRGDLAQVLYQRIFWKDIFEEYKARRKTTPGGAAWMCRK